METLVDKSVTSIELLNTAASKTSNAQIQAMHKFSDTKKKFKGIIQNTLKTNNSYEIDEAALPAYAHKNPLIDFIFWRRVEIAFNMARKNTSSRVLDFGCGSGLLSYALAQSGVNVVANDTVFGPLNIVKKQLDFPKGIDFWEGSLLSRQIPDNYFDTIIALDVLEHINNIDDYITVFRRILKPGGLIIISGPTESLLYKIGRKMAGEKFTGDYHVTNIKTIHSLFAKSMETKVISRLIWPFTLFEIFVARNTGK